ncbi:hypothetical protein [Streptomyces sp. NEAU-W12]|uniref:hypothetical protein n=1 Tax=Streptomyces sp. NEAU-W12 TaxID=2994668 RepID=UPI00224A4F23|nr:hypothetical protein [Streptomyces sp. NEAU-W12]MCX2926850.1 hypothetical protein [Streptomyces sp. NEAU-W12]
MPAVKRWLDRSLSAQAMVIFLLGVGIAALLRRDEHPVIWVVHGALYTGVTVAILAVQRRRAVRAAGVGPGAVADLNRRIRRGEVPRDPEERAAMRRLADDQLDRMQRAGRWFPYWLALMGLVAVGLLVLGVVSGSVVPSVFFAVGTLGFCWWVLWMRRRSMRRLRTARSAVDGPGEPV